MSSVEQAASERPRTGEATETGCPECSGAVRQDGRERVCAACGLVVDADWLDRGPEWRSFENGDESGMQRATGGPLEVAVHDRGLGSMVGFATASAGWAPNTGFDQNTRLDIWQKRIRGGGGGSRNRRMVLLEIRRIVASIELGEDVRDRAAKLFREFDDDVTLHGRALEAWAAASVYAAVRVDVDATGSLADVAAVSKLGRMRVQRAYQDINEALDLPALPPEPSAFVPRVVSDLGGGAELRRAADAICAAAEDAGVHSGCAPTSIAAACVYVAARALEGVDNRTQAEVAGAADVATQTIRNWYRDVGAAVDVGEVVGA